MNLITTALIACFIFFTTSSHVLGQTTPARPFPQELTYAAGTIRPDIRSQAQQNDDVRAFYDHWKSSYLVAAGETAEGEPMYRVSFGSTDPGSTVSEGQGFGMVIVPLLAGYDPDAQAIFDGLWAFVRANPSEIDPRLMDWKVPQPTGNASAFDGDADIAYGLLLADAQWGSGGDIDYAADAARVIAGILESTIGPVSRLPMLGDWVNPVGSPFSQYSTRSSDFMLASFRAYGRATNDPTWETVVASIQSVISTIQTDYSATTGLLPDFIVNTNAAAEPAPVGFLEGPNDGRYYYNAGRVPWRLGTDALINGDDASLAAVQKIASWIRQSSGGSAFNIKAGYGLDGAPIGQYFTTFFVAPMGVAAMTDPAHQSFLNNIYNAVYNRHEDYYEDSVTLLTLLVMTGNYWDPTTVSGTYNEEIDEIPRDLILHGASPNPVQTSSTISYTLKQASTVRLLVHDTLGRQVLAIDKGTQQPGSHTIQLDANDLASGTYVYSLITMHGTTSKPLIVVR